MARLLSIDYGKKRTGIAVTDTLQLIANGLWTVETKELLKFLVDYCAKEEVGRFVVGLPTQTTGEASENQQRVRCFVGELRKALPAIPVEFYDERFTSVLAHRTMLESGIGQKRRRDKALVDEIAATIILQDYMASRVSQFPI